MPHPSLQHPGMLSAMKMTANCNWKAEFSETSELHSEDDDVSEVSPCLWEDFKKINETLTSEEYIQADDSLLQETDDLCIEDKNTESDDEDEETAACKPISKCSEAMQSLGTYCHFLSDMPQSIIRKLWELENFT
jgi:hypothetical protein